MRVKPAMTILWLFIGNNHIFNTLHFNSNNGRELPNFNKKLCIFAPMKFKFYIFALTISALVSLVGCNDEDAVDTQDTAIINYLTNTLRLVTEEEARVSQESDTVAFYIRTHEGAYRYISNYYRAGRESLPKATKSNEVSIYFVSNVFTSAPSGTFFTNVPSLETELQNLGLNTQYWDFTPLSINLSDSNVLKALRGALVDCCTGDIVEVYMNYNIAFGRNGLGVVSGETAVMYQIEILSVT